MKHSNRHAVSAEDEAPALDMASAYAELNSLILDAPDVVDFLHRLAMLAAAIVPGAHCGITLRRDQQVAAVASSDEVARQMDEIQSLRGRGPCIEALQTAHRVDVPDVSTETRWGDYSAHALANGIHNVVSLPLIVDGECVGALNMFGTKKAVISEADVVRVRQFADQGATALTILVRQASRITLDHQLREALATRAMIDQALGILMFSQKITASEAFEALRKTSQNSNRKISAIAAELIETTTGRPPEPPRPLTART